MKILVLGGTGMAGHMISLYFREAGHDVTAFDKHRSELVTSIVGDATDFDALKDILVKGHFDAVINAIGILNQAAEDHKDLAVILNSYLPHFLVSVCKDLKTKVIQMSTDCVFAGNTGPYKEDSFKDGKTFYDRSKALGEVNNEKDLTFRNSIIGPDLNKKGIGLFNWFMKQKGPLKGFTGAIWTGVTTLTLAKAMEQALKEDLCGLYNLVNNDSINKFDLLRLFNTHMRDNKIKIAPDGNYSVDKSLINTRKDFSFEVPSYDKMVREMKVWIDDHKALYSHYFA